MAEILSEHISHYVTDGAFPCRHFTTVRFSFLPENMHIQQHKVLTCLGLLHRFKEDDNMFRKEKQIVTAVSSLHTFFELSELHFNFQGMQSLHVQVNFK